MKYLEIERQENNPENRVRKMLENLYETSIEELNGNFTPEMNETISRIRSSFTNLPSEEELIKNANEKFMKKQLIPVNEKGKKKREKTRLEEENEFIRYQLETKKFRSNNNLKENVQLPMNNFFNNLNRIKEILENENGTRENKERFYDSFICLS